MNEGNEGDRNDEWPGSRAEEGPVINCPHFHFAREIMGAALPHDNPAQGAFDNRCDFEDGDPGAHFGGVHNCDYAMSGDKGLLHWTALFRYLLMHFEHVRWLSTVFVLVDNRDLTESSTPQETLSLGVDHLRVNSVPPCKNGRPTSTNTRQNTAQRKPLAARIREP